MHRRQKISIIGLGHVGLPMMLILSNLKKKGKYLYDVNVVENNDKKGKNIKRLVDKKIFIKSRNLTRKNEIMKTQLNIEKAKKLLKWKPLWSLERGLKFIIKEKIF